MERDPRLRRALAATLVLAVTCAGLATALAIVLRRANVPAELAVARPTDDPAVRKAAIAELVDQGTGAWDTFPDPEVGRLLQPGLKSRNVSGVKVTSNELGLREDPIAIPKPAGTTRIVLLGDSFIFGEKINANDRLGAQLKAALLEHAANKGGALECLHVGLTCWNTVAETAFLTRSLSLLAPDLVLHLVIRNDLEDNPGARGFGRIANFDAARGGAGEPLMSARAPMELFGSHQTSWLECGLDWESRHRFEAAGQRIADLAALVEKAGAKYLMIDYFVGHLPLTRVHFAARLRTEQVCYLPTSLARNRDWKADETHWNKAGNGVVAQALYGLLRERGLLPQLALGDWPAATAAATKWFGEGAAEAAEEPDLDELPARRAIGAAIDFDHLDEESAAQVSVGVARGGLAAPYASMICAVDGARRLKVAGHGLGRVELDGARVEVFVDEQAVGSFVVAGTAPVALDVALPDAVTRRRFASVRFVADRFAYSGDDLRRHVVFVLERVALE